MGKPVKFWGWSSCKWATSRHFVDFWY